MKMVHVTRRERFNAAHKLWNPQWDIEKNQSVFGLCANENWHGHNYNLYVTVKAEPNPDTGYSIDLKVLSTILNDKVVSRLDHKNLNLDVDFMKDKITSTENLCIAIWEQIEEDIKRENAELFCVKLFETENNYAEYFGEI